MSDVPHDYDIPSEEYDKIEDEALSITIKILCSIFGSMMLIYIVYYCCCHMDNRIQPDPNIIEMHPQITTTTTVSVTSCSRDCPKITTAEAAAATCDNIDLHLGIDINI